MQEALEQFGRLAILGGAGPAARKRLAIFSPDGRGSVGRSERSNRWVGGEKDRSLAWSERL